jgi:putative endonuclease
VGKIIQLSRHFLQKDSWYMAPYLRHIVGSQGESLACSYLETRGYDIVGRNYRKKWGEIDIIATKGGIIYFVEVKTVSCKNIESAFLDNKGFRPEENIHPQKLQRLGRVIQTYLAEHNVSHETVWQLDALIVYLDKQNLRARVRSIDNIVLNA